MLSRATIVPPPVVGPEGTAQAASLSEDYVRYEVPPVLCPLGKELRIGSCLRKRPTTGGGAVFTRVFPRKV